MFRYERAFGQACGHRSDLFHAPDVAVPATNGYPGTSLAPTVFSAMNGQASRLKGGRFSVRFLWGTAQGPSPMRAHSHAAGSIMNQAAFRTPPCAGGYVMPSRTCGFQSRTLRLRERLSRSGAPLSFFKSPLFAAPNPYLPPRGVWNAVFLRTQTD